MERIPQIILCQEDATVYCFFFREWTFYRTVQSRFMATWSLPMWSLIVVGHAKWPIMVCFYSRKDKKQTWKLEQMLNTMVKLHWSLKFFSEYSFFNYCHVGKFYTVKQIQVKIYHMIGGNNQMNKTSITTVTLLLHIIKFQVITITSHFLLTHKMRKIYYYKYDRLGFIWCADLESGIVEELLCSQ